MQINLSTSIIPIFSGKGAGGTKMLPLLYKQIILFNHFFLFSGSRSIIDFDEKSQLVIRVPKLQQIGSP